MNIMKLHNPVLLFDYVWSFQECAWFDIIILMK